ncbi:MAG: tRNA (adenosine(37)-N6)-threonylcarbamoyltransferase complex transferase subunit TsaD [Saprospiraceae bacterium]|nr:tRNA (adenosine(37)-N6)-threonylcarbamoyltransferase complex transferase subunit TsaD [Saprospiraceae bacterium]MDW8485107.1 tRNA (adenosine(37)-N6)-threonylcarbamoyltransferase complex transferase subunit TsaD [Saprospiraceae bacterium]
MSKQVTILAIESSCDDTSAAVLRDGRVLSNCIANQEVHRQYGGVVPEVASRAHQVNIVPVVEQALRQAGVKKSELSAVAFTRGPGLMGALLVGTSFAKALALSWEIPLIEVNHLQAHILAHFIEEPKPNFPFLCLTVSGGHTQLVLVRAAHDMEVLGQTLDDAAGEAFDKAGKLLGLDYPAGPLIDRWAQSGQPRFVFPETNVPGLDFSFSGLKTAILYFLRERLAADPQFIEKNRADLCASVQHAIVSALLKTLQRAARHSGIREIALAGGVSANSELRHRFEQLGQLEGWRTYVPALQYCTDNAAMVAMAAYFKYLRGDFCAQDVAPYTRGFHLCD